MNRFYSIPTPFYSPDDFGGGGSPSPAPSDIGAPASTPASTSAIPDPTGTPNGNPNPAATVQAQPEPSWLRGRLDETRRSAERASEARWQTERAQLQAQYEATQRQLHAIVGVTPQEDPNVSQVRDQFNKLYPGLAKLEDRAAQLLEMQERMGNVDTMTQHHWASWGRQSMDRLYGLAEKSIGSGLSDGQKSALHQAFMGFVSSSPEIGQRYAEDPTLVDEYWQNFAGAFIDPIRRTANSNVQFNTAPRNILQDTPAGIPNVQAAPRPGNLDERVAGAWASYNAHTAKKPGF